MEQHLVDAICNELQRIKMGYINDAHRLLDHADAISKRIGELRIEHPKPPWDVKTDVDLAWLAAGELAERRKSHRPVSRQELELVAAIYREHIDGNPTAEVAKVLGYKSPRTAHRRVKEAETAGLLPPTTQGRKRRDV